MMTIAISTGSLIFSMAHSTVQLFASRAASMGAFTVLYIYTPEVRPQAEELEEYAQAVLTS